MEEEHSRVGKMKNDEILETFAQSDMVLVGLGEDFDGMGFLRREEMYRFGGEKLKENGFHWLIPAWNEFCVKKTGNAALDAKESFCGLRIHAQQGGHGGQGGDALRLFADEAVR